MSSKREIDNPFTELIDKDVGSPLVTAYESQLGETARIEEFEGGRLYHTFEKHGLSLCFDDGQLTSVLLYSENSEPGVAAYSGSLPRGLTFSDSQASVRHKLGAPLRSNAADDNRTRAVPSSPWMKYALDHGCEMHVEFDAAGSRIRIVTVQQTA